MSKLFVRQRHHVGEGSGRPRFAIVASEGANLRVYMPRVRRMELEKIASECGAEIVYLPRGEQQEDPAAPRRSSGRRRRRQ